MISEQQIKQILGRLGSVEADLSDPVVLGDRKRYRELAREYAFLKKLESAYVMYELAREDGTDEALVAQSERELMEALVPPDPLDLRNAVVEIRAGTGGEEAGLFAADLERMYLRYAERRGWRVSRMSEGFFTVLGEGAYGELRFEGGTHRVQRVPETEAQGRIHTSAATVVVFPEADEDDTLEIPEKDVRIDLFCAGGAGGQHVNKTESAVRMTHIPTGLVAVCQDERSQQRNREKCFATLKARILDKQRREEAARLGADRLEMVGSGDRSEKIRTYNFPQNRLTDHRINLTLYALDRIIDGELDEIISALRQHFTLAKLAKI
ncbi:MAG: peptide chain release factor 1 [Kiritimatiellae bacterium]|nr:peptide chain release factor 1 [Kiritimatiellia bacterium]